MRPSIAAIAIYAAHLRNARVVFCLGHYHVPGLKQSKVVCGTFGVTSEAVHEGVRVDLQRPVAQLKFTASTSGQPISARLVLVNLISSGSLCCLMSITIWCKAVNC